MLHKARLSASAHKHTHTRALTTIMLTCVLLALSFHSLVSQVPPVKGMKYKYENIQPPYVSGSVLPERPRGRSHPHWHADE